MTPWPSETPGDGVAPCSPKYASSPCSLRSSPESCSRTPALAPSVACTSTRMMAVPAAARSEEHTSELQSRQYLVCRLLLEKKKNESLKLTNALHAKHPSSTKNDEREPTS